MLIDFLFIALFLFSCFLGYRRGFSKIFFNFFAIILSVIISFCLYSSVGDYIAKTTYGTNLQEMVSEKIEKQITPENESEIPSIFLMGIQKTKDDVASYVSQKVVKTIISIFSALIIFIISKIIILITKKMIFKITELPGIHLADSSLGLLLGAISGFVLVVAMYMLSGFITIMADSHFINDQYSQSIILMLISDYFII